MDRPFILTRLIFDTIVKFDIAVNNKFDTAVKNDLYVGVMVNTRQFDEDAVLEVALKTFWQNGFAATSMIDMAEATGVQRGSLYNAYGDKEQLFLLTYERYASRFLETVRQALSNPDPAVALTTLLEGIIASFSAGAPARGCLTTKMTIELPLAGKAIEAQVRRLLEDLTTLIRDALSIPSARRKLSCDPDTAADLVVTFTRGLAVMERAFRNPPHLEKMARQFVKVLVPETRRRR